MRRIGCIALVLAIVVFAATAAPAPETRPLGGLETGVWLILRQNDPRVREELKLSENQVKKIEELIAVARQASANVRGPDGKLDRQKFRDLQDLTKRHVETVAKILAKTQFRRAEQIYLQRLSLMIALRKLPVAAVLKLTEEQKEKMDLIGKEFSQELRGITPVGGGGGPEWLQKKAELRKSQEEKLLNVLTPAQKSNWKHLLGEPLKLEPRRSEEQKQPSQGSDRPALSK